MADRNDTVVSSLSSTSQEVCSQHSDVEFLEYGSGYVVDQHLQDVAAWFDKTVTGHGAGLGQGAGPAGFFAEPYDLVQKLLNQLDCEQKILDLGCGCGADSIALAGETNQVWAVDISPERLATARHVVHSSERHSRISVCWMDAQNLAFPDEFFDLIIANSFLMWVDKCRVLQECNRVLKPGGRVIFSMETMAENPILFLSRMRPSKKQREKMVTRIVLKDLDRFSVYYSRVRSWQFFLFSPILYSVAKWKSDKMAVATAIRRMQRLDSWLLRSFAGLRRLAWVSVLELTK